MVNTVCAVVCCRREAYPGCGVPFHRIPGHPATRKKWIDTIPGNITTSAVVCGAHFKVDDYVSASRKKLKFGTVPSIFPNCELWLKVVANDGVMQLPMEELKNLQACYFHKTQYLREINHAASQSTNQSTNVTTDQSTVPISPIIISSVTCNENNNDNNDEYSSGSDDEYEAYNCNECNKGITGFRYTCVQCADWELCGACEARAAHAAHYVLRVPGGKKNEEVKSALDVIKKQLLKDNLIQEDSLHDRNMEEAVCEVPVGPATDQKYGSVKSEASDSDSDYVVETLDEWLSEEETESETYRPPKHRLPSRSDQSVPSKKAKLETKKVKGISKRKKPVKIIGETTKKKSLKALDLDDDPLASPPEHIKTPLNRHDCSKFSPTGDSLITTNIKEEITSDSKDGIVHLRVPSDTDDEALLQALQSRAYVVMKPLRVSTRSGCISIQQIIKKRK